VVSTYGPVGNFRGGRDGLHVMNPNGTSAIYQPYVNASSGDTALSLWIDSAIVQGTAYARRGASTNDGTCLGNVPCYTYSGTQTFTAAYIRVGLKLVPIGGGPYDTVAVGGTAWFGAYPLYTFHGAAIPDSITRWWWVPHGVIGTTALPGGCLSGSTSCSFRVNETGSIFANGIVNGFGEIVEHKITVPCPTGDTAFGNHLRLRDALLDGLGQLWQNADPYDTATTNRLEQAGWVYQDSTGQWQPWMNPTGGTDACDSNTGSGPAGVLMGAFWGPIHVHPFGKHATLPSTNCPGREGGTYASRPSKDDVKILQDDALAAGQPGMNGVVMDADNIYRYATDGKWVKSPRYNSANGCRVI
jgi:hypothetical protein